MAGAGCEVVFKDLFRSMVENLGVEGFLKELCNWFRLPVDEEKSAITFESLKKKSAMLGLHGHTSDDEVWYILKEGDLDGDGCLNMMEFCVLMFGLNPNLMNKSRLWLIGGDHHTADES